MRPDLHALVWLYLLVAMASTYEVIPLNPPEYHIDNTPIKPPEEIPILENPNGDNHGSLLRR